MEKQASWNIPDSCWDELAKQHSLFLTLLGTSTLHNKHQCSVKTMGKLATFSSTGVWEFKTVADWTF